MTQSSEKKLGDILVVDDIQENLSLLVTILSKHGYHVRPASDGSFALSSARISPPDLILLDVNMPIMNGYMMCESLKADERTAHIPVIFVSALDQPIVKVKAFQAGGVDYISKPYHAEEVLARVATHLQIRKLQEDLQSKNEKLEEEVRLRERVEHIMIHDLKNPLNSIQNFPKIVERQGPLNDFQKNSLKQIKSAGEYMLKIINSTKSLLKIERGEYELNPVPVDIIQILKGTLKEMAREIEIKELQIKLLLDGTEVQKEDQCFVWGENLLCHNIFTNLIKNAIEASQNSDIIVCTINYDENVLVSIHNNQPVPERIRNRFFEKYVTANKQTGTGLGTYSAKISAETMRGSVSLDTSETNGTTVYVELPKYVESKSRQSDDLLQPNAIQQPF